MRLTSEAIVRDCRPSDDGHHTVGPGGGSSTTIDHTMRGGKYTDLRRAAALCDANLLTPSRERAHPV